ncbi:MAG: amidase [Acetobacteraceae bacterium]|nr:amidase [Acetobacteraceae bacterium]MDW8399416.1 amidase [Acetobacteraceae bacterium]
MASAASDSGSPQHDADPFGAFVARAADGPAVPHAASGPLAGLSFAVKDLLDVAGFVTRAGNPDWAAGRAPAAAHAESVRRCLDAGAQFAGKTHTDELSRGIFGETSQHGRPRNPLVPGRVPGGSSSGSAVAVASGLADFALGTDTGGSVRAPASFCGLFGLRPTHGRVPFAGVIAQAPSFDTVGWLACDAAVLARVGAVLLDPWRAPPAQPARIVWAEDLAALCDAEVIAPVRRAAEAALGPLEAARFDPAGPERFLRAQAPLQSAEAWRSFAGWIDAANPRFTFEVAASFAAGRDIPPERLAEAAALRDALRAETPRFFAGGAAVFAFPAMPFPPPPAGLPLSRSWPLRMRIVTLTAVAGLLGAPVLVAPGARVEGLPVGVALMAAPGGDEALLALAQRFAASTATSPPPGGP